VTGPDDVAVREQLQMTLRPQKWVRYDPASSTLHEGVPLHIEQSLRRRAFLLEKARLANIVGSPRAPFSLSQQCWVGLGISWEVANTLGSPGPPSLFLSIVGVGDYAEGLEGLEGKSVLTRDCML
jgi:hypothetical protein